MKRALLTIAKLIIGLVGLAILFVILCLIGEIARPIFIRMGVGESGQGWFAPIMGVMVIGTSAAFIAIGIGMYHFGDVVLQRIFYWRGDI